jgi:general secretion pathway protein L
MSLLRIRCPLLEEPLSCQWIWIGDDELPLTGEGQIADLPKNASSVQLIIPAAQVLLTRARLPDAARRQTGSVLAFAVEEEMLREPDANQVSWIGFAGDEGILAAVDKKGLTQCLDTLQAAAIPVDEIYCETLLLPWTPGEWSFSWDGQEGFVRTGEFEGGATDCGDDVSPPLSLHLMLEDAERHGARPASIALYTIEPEGTMTFEGSAGGTMKNSAAAPDIEAWQRVLSIPVYIAGTWDWRRAPQSSISLLQERKRWPLFSGLFSRLRPAVWIGAAALVIHSLAVAADWALLANEERTLHQQMETRFRTLFPAAVAVVDPALQMRRKLGEARHGAGVPDTADFLPMIKTVEPGLNELAPGSLRAVSYDSGRITLELAAEEGLANRIATRLRENDLSVDINLAPADAGAGIVVLVVRAP